MLKNVFTQLGLEEREMNAYLTLLKSGSKTASEFAALLKQPRSTTYFIIDRLKEVGVVEEFDGASAKVFRSVPPAALTSILSLREKRFQYVMDEFQKLVPQLTRRQSAAAPGPAVEFHEGKEVVERLFTKSRKKGNTEDSWSIMYNPEVLHSHMPVQLNPDKYADDDTPYRELVTDSAFSRAYQAEHKDRPLLQIRILPKEFTFDSNIGVNGSTVHFTAIAKHEEDSVNMRVHNPVLARQFLQIFDTLWEQSH